MSKHTANNNINSFNNTNTFNVWNSSTVADDRSQLLSWLSPLEPKLRHRDVQERRVNNIGEWLIQSEEFRRWCGVSGEGKGDNAVLFCYGHPGVGKTFLSSLVVDRLRLQQNIALGCFYFDFAARRGQTATSVLGCLVKQMVNRMERIPEEISWAFQEQKKDIGGCAPQLIDMVKMLQALTSSQPTYMCLDALDECEAAQRVRLLDSLKEILQRSPRIRIFVTGRPHIRAEIEKRLAGRVTSVSANPTRGDIITYLRVRLGEDETPDAMDESLRADILKKIPEMISEMFLLVSLNMDAILQESTIHRRRERLSKMTEGFGLGDAYGATIERIKAQCGDKSRLGIAALMWISHAERPLRAEELCHALAVELGSPGFNASNIPSVSTLVSCCQGLITVDQEASTVRLIHFTLQEYLSAHPDIFTTPHSLMAETCMTFLKSEQFKPISVDRYPDLSDTPFLEYCSLYWGVHAKKELSDNARSLALDLLQECDGHISTRLLLKQIETLDLDSFGPITNFNGLHCASFFGIVEVVTALIEKGCHGVNEGAFCGLTPLAWAALNGHERVVEILLGRGEVDPNKPCDTGQTPLSYAAEGGHVGVVQMLLRRENVSPDKPDKCHQTPLSHAAGKGHEGVVKILLGREEVDPDSPDYLGITPLSYAAQGGHEGVVKVLHDREEVGPDKPDCCGQTPLSYAAGRGREGVVKILLGLEQVNPDRPDDYDRTPLLYAAWNGHEGVVEILLGREEVSPDRPDSRGQTPLSYAASCGHEEAVKTLLVLQEVNPNRPDNRGQTPLMLATSYGHKRVVALLQSHKAIARHNLKHGRHHFVETVAIPSLFSENITPRSRL